MSFSRTASTLGLLALAVGLGACGPDGPAIQEVSPGKGEANVAADADVRVTFNHDMDRTSVESRFNLKPAIPGCDDVACPITWQGRTMVMNHSRIPFTSDTHYRATLKPGYRDTAGRMEGVEHFWDFHTEAAPTVGAVVPADGATGVAADADITVQLSRAVLVPPRPELTIVGANDPEPISYRVAVAPDDSRKLVISPLSLLHPRTSYTIHLGAGIQDVHHNPLAREQDFNFVTGPVDMSRSLAFLVRDETGGTASRIAALRPPAGVNGPAPSLRVLYNSDRPITAFDWSADAASLDVLDSAGAVTVVPLDGSSPRNGGLTATAIAANPAHPELAYVTPAGELHLWDPTGGADQLVAQAGRVVGAPGWSGDGRRLAVVVDDGAGGRALRLLDRETLGITSVTVLPGPPAAGGVTMAWTNDGAALAFARPATALPEVWTFRPLAAEGTGLTRIGVLDTAFLDWSSDGGILFGAGRTTANGASLLQQALGQPLDGQPGGFSPVRGSRGGDSEPVAPAFDRRVAFIRPAAGKPQLYIMNNDGTGVAQLTYATYDPDDRLPSAGVDLPTWAPGTIGG